MRRHFSDLTVYANTKFSVIMIFCHVYIFQTMKRIVLVHGHFGKLLV